MTAHDKQQTPPPSSLLVGNIDSLASAFQGGFTNGNAVWDETPEYHKEMFREGVRSLLSLVDTPSPSSQLMGSEPAIIRLPWHKEPHGDFWRAEVIGHVYEVHDDEMADYKKRQCQYDFEARIRSALVPPATATEGSGE